jgi:hypothetical protein
MEHTLKKLLLKSFQVQGSYKQLVDTDLGFVDFTAETL